MAGHTVTPFEITAIKRHARKNKDVLLNLACLGAKANLDLLDALETSVTEVDAISSSDGTRKLTCELAEREGDYLFLVFASEISGEQEIILDEDDGSGAPRGVAFLKGQKHYSKYFACCVVHRDSQADRGTMLLHSPWGRGGSKSQVVKLLQSALNAQTAKAKIRADAKVPQAALDAIIQKANATKITYSRTTGVTSQFGDSSANQSAPAEMALVVKGQSTLPYRDALSAALKSKANRKKLFVVKVADPSDPNKFHEETFDDVAVDVTLPGGGTRRYSIKDDTVPSLGFNLTSEINNVYWALPRDDYESWPERLIAGVRADLVKTLKDLG